MFDRNVKTAFIVACVLLVGGKFGLEYSAAALKIFLQKQPVPMRDKFQTIPVVIGNWKKVGDDRPMAKEVIETLGTELYLNREYRTLDQSCRYPLDVHLAYYTGMIDAVPHVADRCMVAAGYEQQSLPSNEPLSIDTSAWQTDSGPMNRKTGKPYPFITHRSYFTGDESMVRMPLGDFELRVTEFSDPKNPGTRLFAGYLFIANGCTTPTPESVRWLAFDRTDKYAYYCKVQFLMGGRQELTRTVFLDAVAEFLGEFLPEVMRCLPDWAEVEAKDAPSAKKDSRSSQD